MSRFLVVPKAVLGDGNLVPLDILVLAVLLDSGGYKMRINPEEVADLLNVTESNVRASIERLLREAEIEEIEQETEKQFAAYKVSQKYGYGY